MRITIDDDWTATVTGAPLRLAPRFDFRDFRVRVAEYANVEERGGFLLDTFGSGPWLWDTPDELRFDKEERELVGAEFQIAARPPTVRTPPAFPRHPLRPSGRPSRGRGPGLPPGGDHGALPCPRGHRADLSARPRRPGRTAGRPHRHRPRHGAHRPARHRRRLEPDRPRPLSTTGFTVPDPAPPRQPHGSCSPRAWT
ncbi:hypothetical protein ACFQ51_31150 [Streptomyces kaempferi]